MKNLLITVLFFNNSSASHYLSNDGGSSLNYYDIAKYVVIIVIICIILSTILQIGILTTLNQIKNEIDKIKSNTIVKNSQNIQTEVEKTTCTNCGAKFNKSNNQKFCEACGNKLI